MYNAHKVSVMKDGWNYSSSRIFSTSSPAPKIDDINAEIQPVIGKNKRLL
jgi:hypothetical protein